MRQLSAVALGLVLLSSSWGVWGQGSRSDVQSGDARTVASSINVNPHWRADGCDSCHNVSEGGVEFIVAATVNDLCLACHDGKTASREAHPIYRTFANPQIVQPPDWPAPDGFLSCLTCHEVLTGCRTVGARPAENPAMLRKIEGEIPDPFCGACHVEEFHQRHNPHILRATDGWSRDKFCQTCHEEGMVFHPRYRRDGESMLRAAEVSLCARCHTSNVEYFEPGHIGAIMKPDLLAGLRRTELRLGQSTDSRQATWLPLGEDDSIQCSTCHNPHPVGLFPDESALALGAVAPPATAHDGISTRIGAGALCAACHEK